MKRYILVPLDRRRSVQGSALIGILSAVVLAVVAGGLGVWLGGQGLLTLDLGGTTQPAARLQGKPSTPDRSIQQITRHGAQPADRQAAKNEDINAHIDAVSGQVGAMQAKILRLNALGERLVEMAGLSKDEFDFQAPPPQGGPDTGGRGPAAIDALAEELASVLSELDDRNRKLTLLEQLIMERHLGEQMAAPSGWPVRAGYITSTYGFRKDPFRGRGAFHKGIDFAGVRGSPVIAVAEGVVTFSGRQSGYGNLVEIRHSDGKSHPLRSLRPAPGQGGCLHRAWPDHSDPRIDGTFHRTSRPLRDIDRWQAGQPHQVRRSDQSGNRRQLVRRQVRGLVRARGRHRTRCRSRPTIKPSPSATAAPHPRTPSADGPAACEGRPFPVSFAHFFHAGSKPYGHQPVQEDLRQPQ